MNQQRCQEICLGLGLAAALVVAPGRGALGAGTTAAEFLRFGVGGPVGLSEASGSVVEDATALHWNPAGLAALEHPELYLAHHRLPESLRLDYLGAAYPIQGGRFRGVLGYSLQLLRQDTIPKLDNAGNPQGTFSASDMAHTIGWARNWGQTRVGALVRLIRQSIDVDAGTSVALGLGAQRNIGKGLAGVSLMNLGPGLSVGNESFPLPLTFRAGASWRFARGLGMASDLSVARGRGTQLHLGGTYRGIPRAVMRVGYTLGSKDEDGPSGLALGAGFDWRALGVDFSWQPFGGLGHSVQFGLRYRWETW